MPQAVVVAGITAAGGLGSALLANKSNKRAAEAHERAASEALAYEKERESYARSVEERKWEDYRRRHAAWEARNFGGKGGAPAAKPDVRASGNGYSVRPRMTLGSMQDMGMGGVQGMAAQLAPAQMAGQAPRKTLGGASWADWDQYGV